ncbi:Nmad3 family putative nucleotide modification protein [Alkalicoccus luteus]|uniref:Nmad3 family putative nucleotide modification protein n=1 Tax=Alkalicoccus luteus TaxID=1237094 RepID=UPI004033ECFC
MENLIFSRKGFDSSAGYGYSPYDPETGKYVVLPIPETEKREAFRYRDLTLSSDALPGLNASSMYELIQHPALRYSSRAKAASEGKAHYDPVLGKPEWLDAGPDFGVFGQSGAAAGHLHGHETGKGSLFLFFSRFKPLPARLHKLDPEAGWTEGVYFLYGWLRVGDVWTLPEQVPEEVRRFHPHGTAEAFRKKNNTLYAAAAELFPGSGIPGSGYFPRLKPELQLSSSLHKNRPGIWRLPALFYEEAYRPTYLQKEENWLQASKSDYYVQSSARGQEYISKLDSQSRDWVEQLFRSAYS